ncbi:hypothetical protein DICPUDRAFT_42013 [Dictyostelium purpureum]|uniref:Uncharacterized protein n=1 Tax=Dictyostelium purpureum TaxID=5786 RepID=F1A192_DICPU|nr:uncharacterized protein DICPUDRAFT_42013 [Dictyostelium purpureum]EGC30042.1 hypothetical protein DICPUDRAFT_42013 [Dictyostelium purpureum]|eukprot:XP_003293429.1 hypothetical protein DICPUDRAFT_42013 [Dictyostelium purpureum]
MDRILSFNDKLISLFNSLDGRDKVFKFVQYFSKIIYYCVEKKYIYKIINIIFKKIIITNKNKLFSPNINNKINRNQSINKEYFKEKIVVEKLKSLETSLYDARSVFRLFGFFREFKNVVEYFKSINFKEIYNYSNNKSKIINLVKSLNSFTNIKKSFLTILELLDLFFSFVSEINDIGFWAIRIKLFQIKYSFFYKFSDFIWIYSLAVFIFRLVYGLVLTQISILKHVKDNNNNNNNNNKELEILKINRKNEIRSLISAIGELGLCICSIYEIDNDLIIGLSGSVSAFISLQEIWKEICIEKENEENEENIKSSPDTSISSNSNQSNNTSSPILGYTHAHVCPPQIHIHSNN